MNEGTSRIVKIRPIEKDDCCREFETGLFAFDRGRDGHRLGISHYWNRFRQGYEVYVIADRETIQAILCLKVQGRKMHFSRIGVYKDYQGLGYMRRMLMWGLKRMDELGITIATARVRNELVPVLEEVFGFEVVRGGEDPHWGKYADMKLETG